MTASITILEALGMAVVLIVVVVIVGIIWIGHLMWNQDQRDDLCPFCSGAGCKSCRGTGEAQ